MNKIVKAYFWARKNAGMSPAQAWAWSCSCYCRDTDTKTIEMLPTA